MPETDGGNGGADRQKKGRWKRAAQVCTSCRQMKVRYIRLVLVYLLRLFCEVAEM